jgi:hypothetical protein
MNLEYVILMLHAYYKGLKIPMISGCPSSENQDYTVRLLCFLNYIMSKRIADTRMNKRERRKTRLILLKWAVYRTVFI